jgi:predicted secreted hydrolase
MVVRHRWLADAAAGALAGPAWGFQLTFFRSRTGLADAIDSRFAPRQLLFAHAALTDLRARRLVHAERIVRWNGDENASRGAASLRDTQVHIGDWQLQRDGGGTYRAALGDETAGFEWRLSLGPDAAAAASGRRRHQPQGPAPGQRQPLLQPAATGRRGRAVLGRRARAAVRGRAWLDHEWSGSLMPERAVGWDWLGINLADGAALMAFRLRDAQGAPVWAGGTLRTRDGTSTTFGPGDVRFEPLQWWSSAATRARYPVRWRVACPAGTYVLAALLEAQELDGRATTGTVYWEGLSELLDERGDRIGLGYLEMTGYAGALRL